MARPAPLRAPSQPLSDWPAAPASFRERFFWAIPAGGAALPSASRSPRSPRPVPAAGPRLGALPRPGSAPAPPWLGWALGFKGRRRSLPPPRGRPLPPTGPAPPRSPWPRRGLAQLRAAPLRPHGAAESGTAGWGLRAPSPLGAPSSFRAPSPVFAQRGVNAAPSPARCGQRAAGLGPCGHTASARRFPAGRWAAGRSSRFQALEEAGSVLCEILCRLRSPDRSPRCSLSSPKLRVFKLGLHLKTLPLKNKTNHSGYVVQWCQNHLKIASTAHVVTSSCCICLLA